MVFSLGIQWFLLPLRYTGGECKFRDLKYEERPMTFHSPLLYRGGGRYFNTAAHKTKSTPYSQMFAYLWQPSHRIECYQFKFLQTTDTAEISYHLICSLVDFQPFYWRPTPAIFHRKSDHPWVFLWHPKLAIFHRRLDRLQPFYWWPKPAFFTGTLTISRHFLAPQTSYVSTEVGQTPGVILATKTGIFTVGLHFSSDRKQVYHVHLFYWWPKLVMFQGKLDHLQALYWWPNQATIHQTLEHLGVFVAPQTGYFSQEVDWLQPFYWWPKLNLPLPASMMNCYWRKLCWFSGKFWRNRIIKLISRQ